MSEDSAKDPGANDAGESRAARIRADRRSQILKAATEVFAESGYHAASVSGIIKRAGIARGTFYLYFSSKHKVFDSILDEALQALASRIELIRLDAAAPPPRDQLADNLRRVIGYLFDDRALSQLLLNHALTPDAESIRRMEAFFGNVTAMLESSLEQGIRMGLVRPCDTSLVAAALLGAVRGVATRQLALSEPPDLDRVVEELLAFGLHGVIVLGEEGP